MKITITFLFFLIASVNINAFSQNINLNVQNTAIRDIIKTIEQRSDYVFLVRDNVGRDIEKRQTVNVSSSSIDTILKEVLKNTSIKYQVLGSQVVLYKGDEPRAAAPATSTTSRVTTQRPSAISVKGTIVDENNIPVIGATVRLKGSDNIGTITNVDGLYSLDNIPADGILTVSSLGYENMEILVNNKPTIDVTLTESLTSLKDVVVIGYGQTTRGNLTSAQTSVSSEDILKTINTTFDQALQGRSAGVMVTSNSGQPGGGISVNIRGISTLSGTTEPLYVIDGVQIQPQITGYNNTSSLNPLAQLNPNDIESMEILQGPSASAIYGSRATNGVVLVTTKRGKRGDTKIDYDFMYGLQDRPNELPVLNLREYVTMNNELRRYMGNAIPLMQQDSSILGEGTNWQREIFKRAPLIKHQLSFSGGTDKLTYYLSAERFNQEGVVLGSGFDRTGLRVNLDNQAKKWLKIGLNLNMSQTNDNLSTTVTDAIRYAFTLPPYIPVRNPDGTYGGYPAEEVQYHNEDLNPFAKAELMTHTSKRNNFSGGINLAIDIIKGLQFRTSINGSFANTNNTDFTPTYRIGTISKTKAELNKALSESFYWNWNQLLEYKLNLLDKHDFTFMVSHESQETRYEGLSGYRTGFPVNEMADGIIPGIGLGDAIGQSTGGYKGWWAQESYLGRVSYNYADKYLLTATYRADGSVNFGENNRWGFFPSASVAWRVSQEEFFQNLTSVVSDFKIRYETGITGNQGSGSGVYAPMMAVPTPWGNGFRITRYKNPDLKWEETLTHNVGFNLGFWSNRLVIDGDYYIRNTRNLLMPNPLPYYMGTTGSGNIEPPFVNLGALQNNGWALTIKTVNIDTKDWFWSSNFNISHNKTTIKKFYQETSKVDMTNWKAGGGFIQRSAVGNEAWQFWGYQSDGIFTSLDEVNSSPVPQRGAEPVRIETGQNGVWIGDYKFKDLTGEGLISPEDMTYIGNPYPDFILGFANDVTWKGLTVSLLLTGSIGNDIYNAFKYTYSNPGPIYTYGNALRETYQNYARIGYDAYGEPYLKNPNATVARYGGGNGNWERASDRFVEDGSYLRIKNLTFNYQVPAEVLRKLKFVQAVRIGFGIQNLYTFTKYSGFDPEIGIDVGHNSDVQRRTFGVDVGQYPQVRSYNFNLGISL